MRVRTDISPSTGKFHVESDFEPSGDQPAAIAELEKRIRAGEKDVVLLGATGTGKSATTAWLIEKLQRPTLVMAPNKTLAAQLANEFREICCPTTRWSTSSPTTTITSLRPTFPQSDTYIEKDSSVNDEVERLAPLAPPTEPAHPQGRGGRRQRSRASTVWALRRSMSTVALQLARWTGDRPRHGCCASLVDIQYTRNDLVLHPRDIPGSRRHGRGVPGLSRSSPSAHRDVW